PTRTQRVRAAAAPLGCRAHLRVVEPLSALEQRLRTPDFDQRGADLSHDDALDAPATGARITLQTASKTSRGFQIVWLAQHCASYFPKSCSTRRLYTVSARSISWCAGHIAAASPTTNTKRENADPVGN